jgi:outer membrane protein assembly factor BamD (BamD/ComL family)
MRIEASKPLPLNFAYCIEGPYELGLDAFRDKEWDKSITALSYFVKKFPEHPDAETAYYMIGYANLQLKEYAFANTAFSSYLATSSHPILLDEVIKYKFTIAEHLQRGEGRRLFGWKKSPKWISCDNEAIEIYDEIATIFPHDEMASFALYNKGAILLKQKQFKESIAEFQATIRRFPRSFMASMSYEAIAISYLRQALLESNNPDYLAMSEVNLKKFKEAFPLDERLLKLEGYISSIKEANACAYYNMGCFYERTDNRRAAWIYYRMTLEKFPETRFAFVASDRLKILCLPEA